MAGAMGADCHRMMPAPVDTPFDTPDKVHLQPVAAGTSSGACYDMVNDNNDQSLREELALPVHRPIHLLARRHRRFRRGGRVVEFDPRRSFIPDRDSGGLAVVESNNKTYGRSRPMVEQVDDRAPLTAGVAPLTAYGYNRHTSRRITSTPRRGHRLCAGLRSGARDYPLSSISPRATKRRPSSRSCVSTQLDIDPQMLRAFRTSPFSMAICRAAHGGMPFPPGVDQPRDDAAVILCPPDPEMGSRRTRIKVLMGAGPSPRASS